MFSIVLWMGCSEPSEPKESYKTTQTVDDTGDTEPSDTGTSDPDTGEEDPEEALHRLYFKQQIFHAVILIIMRFL